MYVLAAAMLGMRFVYLEGGSGSKRHVPGSVVRAARNMFNGFLIVGGGLRTPEAVREVVLAGADGIVLGTVLEVFDLGNLRSLVMAARRG
jgi:phosphoglycerol geranylgeranyltransferase